MGEWSLLVVLATIGLFVAMIPILGALIFILTVKVTGPISWWIIQKLLGEDF